MFIYSIHERIMLSICQLNFPTFDNYEDLSKKKKKVDLIQFF